MKKPWLIQRMKFKKGGSGTFDGVFACDYMGSAEFEFGALPKSLKRCCSSVGSFVFRATDITSTLYDDNLFIVSDSAFDISEYSKFLKLDIDGNLRLKEITYLDKVVTGVGWGGEKVVITDYHIPHAWWDLDNDVFFTFGQGNADHLLAAIVETRNKKQAEGAEGWF